MSYVRLNLRACFGESRHACRAPCNAYTPARGIVGRPMDFNMEKPARFGGVYQRRILGVRRPPG